MKANDRVIVSKGRGFGGPAKIVEVLYRVEYDHDQPAGGRLDTVAARTVTKVPSTTKSARRRPRGGR
jgi:hypothetical protein